MRDSLRISKQLKNVDKRFAVIGENFPPVYCFFLAAPGVNLQGKVPAGRKRRDDRVCHYDAPDNLLV